MHITCEELTKKHTFLSSSTKNTLTPGPESLYNCSKLKEEEEETVERRKGQICRKITKEKFKRQQQL